LLRIVASWQLATELRAHSRRSSAVEVRLAIPPDDEINGEAPIPTCALVRDRWL
jgi:hypothetical protein